MDYVEDLHSLGFDVKVSYVRAIFRSWRWSWRKPCKEQLQKYTDENIVDYLHFLSWVRNEVSWDRLKFLDEGK
jgi:hypothetical protein